MRPLIAMLLICSSAAGPASADYSLPDVKERLVLLLDRKDVGLNERGLALSVDKIEHEFKVDRFWMQDRIWSDGICVGVQDSDEKSSAARIREVRRAIEMKKESLVLLELDLGAVEYLSKPFELEQAAQILQRALGRSPDGTRMASPLRSGRDDALIGSPTAASS